MAFVLSTVRANQKSAMGLSNQLFNGVVAVALGIADATKLKFYANIAFTTGDASHPTKTFSPCTDDGAYKVFSNINDVVKWINGAFLDVTEISFVVEDAELLAKAFVPPTDAVADALKQKNKFIALKEGLQDNKTRAIARVANDVASGWDLGTAHPALQANYASDVSKKDVVLAIEAYYTARIAHFAAIV